MMKFIILTVTAIAGLALGQATNQQGLNLPKCATDCVSEFVGGSKLGKCELIDIKCICENDAFLDSIACCLTRRCEPADQEKAATEALKFCGIAGAIGLPTAVTCATATGKATAAQASATTTSTKNAASQITGGMGAGAFGAFMAVIL